MNSKIFKQLPKNELYFGFQETYKNAVVHYEVAIKASGDEHYGMANSLLILSVEECMKCFLLMAGFFNVDIPFEIEPFFRDHKTKHSQASEMQPILSKFWRFKDSFIDMFKERKSDFHFVVNVGLSLLGISLNLKDAKLEDYSKWWKDANTKKNNGFYVGYYNNKWSIPNAFDKKMYQDALSMAKPFIEFLSIVKSIKPNDYELLDLNGQ